MAISPAQSKDIRARREAYEAFDAVYRCPETVSSMYFNIAFKAGWEAHKAHVKGKR